MAESIRAYASRVGKPGEWLDWLDAVLFAVNMDKHLGFINYNVARPSGVALEIEDANASLKEIPGSDLLNVSHTFQRTEDAWCLLACNASFDKRARANHWVPCVCKENVPESTYNELVAQQIASLKVSIAELQSQLLDMELEDDPEVSAQMTVSLNDNIFA